MMTSEERRQSLATAPTLLAKCIDLADKTWPDASADEKLALAFAIGDEALELAEFEHRVRLPFSGAIAALYSRLDAWKRERVERRAQAAFEWGWV